LHHFKATTQKQTQLQPDQAGNFSNGHKTYKQSI